MMKMTVSMTTPEYDGDDDLVYDLDLPDKAALHRVERSLVRALDQLGELVEDELATGKKALAGSNPQLVIFEANITKDGKDFGGYRFRWPNQTNEARAYLAGMLEGLMKRTGHGDKGRRVRRGRRA